MPLLREMLKNPRVIGVKNSSMPTQDIQMFKDEGAKSGRDFVVFNGPDEQFIAGRMIGADGGIGGTYSAMPELFVTLNKLFEAGDVAKARALQYDINNVIYKLCSGTGNLYAMIKDVLRRREGLDLGGVREPLYNMVEGDEAIVLEAVAMIDAAVAKYVS